MIIGVGSIHEHGIHIDVAGTPGNGAIIISDNAVLAARYI